MFRDHPQVCIAKTPGSAQTTMKMNTPSDNTGGSGGDSQSSHSPDDTSHQTLSRVATLGDPRRVVGRASGQVPGRGNGPQGGGRRGGAPDAGRSPAGTENNRQITCFNCGKQGHISRQCAANKQNRFQWRQDTVEEAVHEMNDRTNASGDVIRELVEENKQLVAAAQAKDDKEEEDVTKPTFEIETVRPIRWTTDDKHYEFLEEQTRNLVSPQTWNYLSPFLQGRYTQTNRLHFRPIEAAFGLGSLTLGSLISHYGFFKTAQFVAPAVKFIIMARDPIQAVMSKMPFLPKGPELKITSYLIPAIKFGIIGLTSFCLHRLLSRFISPFGLFKPLPRNMQIHTLHIDDTGPEPPEEDLRADAIAAGDLLHPDTQHRTVQFTHHDIQTVIPGIYLSRARTRKALISLEMFTQLTMPGNVILSATNATAWDKIQYTGTHLHSVNFDRSHTLQNQAICVDTQLAAFGRRKEIAQQRSHEDFCSGQQAK